jgi:hypothetical protein
LPCIPLRLRCISSIIAAQRLLEHLIVERVRCGPLMQLVRSHVNSGARFAGCRGIALGSGPFRRGSCWGQHHTWGAPLHGIALGGPIVAPTVVHVIRAGARMQAGLNRLLAAITRQRQRFPSELWALTGRRRTTTLGAPRSTRRRIDTPGFGIARRRAARPGVGITRRYAARPGG